MNQPLTDSDKKTLTDLLTFCKTSIDDYGGCDHSTNICFCGAARTLESAANLFHSMTDGAVGWPSIDKIEPRPRNMNEVMRMFSSTDVPAFMAGQQLEMD